MHVTHCIATAKLLNLKTNRIVEVDIVERYNHKKEVVLPQDLEQKLIKRMNKDKKIFSDAIRNFDFETMEKYRDYQTMELTYAVDDRVHGISLTSELEEKFTRGRGSDIACGRVRAGQDWLNGKRDNFPVFAYTDKRRK